MKIKSITISGMHNILNIPKTYTFKDINYLIGGNGAGKSTVLQAIQLAILGYIPGTDKRVSEIFNHSSARSMIIDLRLTNDSSVDENSEEAVKIVRSWSVKGRSVQSNVVVVPEDFEISTLITQIELPIFNFNDFLGLSRNQMKSWFLNFLPKPKQKLDWKQIFATALYESGYVLLDESYIDAAIEESVSTEDGLEGVQNTNANLKEMLAAKKLEVARLEGAVQTLIFYDDVSVEDYEGQKAEILSKLKEVKDLQSKISETSKIIQFNQRTQEKIDKYSSNLPSKEQVEFAEALLASKDDTELQLLNSYEAIKREYEDSVLEQSKLLSEISQRSSIIRGHGICPYTHESCDSIIQYIESLKSEVTALQEKEVEIQRKIEENGQKLNMQSIAVDKFKKDVKDCEALLSRNASIVKDIDELKYSLIPMDESSYQCLEFSLEELVETESKLQSSLLKLEANHAYEEKINDLTANKYTAENELEALKIWIKRTDANGLQTELAELPFNEFTKSMNQIVPSLFEENVKFKLNLESKANSFSFGICKVTPNREIYIPYDLMSSGEKTLLAFSIMLYIVQNSSASLKLLMIDDMLDHLDNSNFDALFTKFLESDIQIINAGVKPIDNSDINIIHI